MAARQGNLSINSDNIFPIIKKWLYSDHDIFFRELISNGCDAITKLKKLDMMGEYTLADDYKAKIQVIVNPEEKTLKFIDNGIGMTEEEISQLFRTNPESKIQYNKIGVKNIQERIQILYGTEYGLSYESEPDRYTIVSVLLPFESKRGEDIV